MVFVLVLVTPAAGLGSLANAWAACRAWRESLFLADHAQKMLDLRDHAAGLRRVGNLGGAPDPVELEPDQGLALGMVAANRAADLLDLDHLVGLAHIGLPARRSKGLVGDLFGITLAAARLQGRHFDVAPRSDRARRILALERIEGRPHHVVGVGRTHRFRYHVLHAERFEHRAHRSAGDDAGTGRSRAQKDLAGTVAPGHVVMQRAAFAQRYPDEAALGGFGRLTDRLRHLARLAVAETDPALLVADNDERGKSEPSAALHHLGHAIDVDKLVGEFALFPLAFTCHKDVPFDVPFAGSRPACPLEFEAAFACRLRKRFDASVIAIPAAVEDHIRDALAERALGHQLADRLGGTDIGAGLEASAHILLDR